MATNPSGQRKEHGPKDQSIFSHVYVSNLSTKDMANLADILVNKIGKKKKLLCKNSYLISFLLCLDIFLITLLKIICQLFLGAEKCLLVI